MNKGGARAPRKERATMPIGYEVVDQSVRTCDADISYRSGVPELDLGEAVYLQDHLMVVGDTTDLMGRRCIKSCLKVKTQRDSLSRASSSSDDGELPPFSSICQPRPSSGRRRRRKTIEANNLRDSFSLNARLAHTSNERPSCSRRNTVQFESVEIREYPRALSDNPSTTSGPPIGLSWKYSDTISIEIDLFESHRLGTRRTKREFAIPSHVREKMLLKAGYSRHEIRKAASKASQEKGRRIASINQQRFDPILERINGIKFSVKRMILSVQ